MNSFRIRGHSTHLTLIPNTIITMTDQEKNIIEARVKNALEQIRPYLQQDGGDVEYVDMTNEGVVMVRLQGHCGSCPHALQTLKQGIETSIKRVIPEVKSIERI